MSYLKQLQMQRQLEERAKQEKKTRELSEKELKDADAAIDAAKKIDASTADVEAVLEEARAAIRGKDYKVGLEKAQEAREKAGRVYRERVKAIVDSSGTMVDLARSIGEDAAEGADFHGSAMDALKKGEMEKAVDFAKKSWKATEKGLYEHLSNAFSQAQALILTAKNAEKDVSVPEDLLSRARTALEQNDYESAMAFTRDCMENVSSVLRDDVRGAMEAAEGLLSLATEVGAKVEKAEGILQRGREELEALEFDKAMNSTKQATADLRRLISKGVEEGVARIQQEIEDAKELGADVSAIPKRIQEAQKKAKSVDLQDAVGALRDAYEEARRAKFQVVLQTIAKSKEKYQTALKIGADLGKALDYLNKARESLNAGNFREALQHAQDGDAEVDRLVKDFEEVESRIRGLQQRFTFADEIGLDMTKPRSMLESARLALKSREFGRVLDFIQACEEATERAEYEHTMQKVEAAEQAITLEDKMGLDTGGVNDLLEQAIVATKAKDYHKAIQLALKTRAEAVKVLEDKILNTISDYQEAIPLTGRAGVQAKKLFDKAESAFAAEDYEQAWKFASDGASLLEGEVKERTSHFQESIDLADKLASALEVAIPDLAAAREDAARIARSGSYEETVAATERHRDRIGAAVDAIFEAVKGRVVEARNLKLETDDLVAKLKKAKIARGTEDFRDSLRKMTEVSVSVEDALDAYHRAYNTMSATAAMVAEAKKKGVDVSNVLRTLLRAKKLFEAADMEQAFLVAQEAKDQAEEVMALYNAARNITEARSHIEIAEENGFDPAEVRPSLDQAKLAMKEKRYREALELSSRARDETTEFLRDNVSRIIGTTVALIEEARERGFDITEAADALAAANEQLETGAFAEALEAARTSKGEIDGLYNLRQEAKEALREAQAALEQVRAINVEAPRATALLKRIEKAFETHRYEEAKELSARLPEEVEVERKAYITQTIAQFEEAIAKARAEGIHTESAEGYIQEAKEHLAGGRYREALELAMQSENEVERVHLQQDMAAKALDTARKKLEEFGAPVPAARSLMGKAEEAFGAGDYVQALELAIQSGDEFQRLAEAWEESKERLDEVEALRSEAEQVGADIAMGAELLDAARQDLESGESKAALAKAAKASAALRKAALRAVESLIEEAKARKTLAEELVVEVPGFNSAVSESRALLEEGDFVKARTAAAAAMEDADEAVERRAAEVFANSKAAVAHAKKMGADVTESVRILKESRTAMRAKEYQQGIQLAERSVEVVESTRKLEKQYIDLTYQADLSISSAKRFGIDVDAAEAKLLDAIEAKGTDLNAAIDLAKEAVQEANEAVEAFAPNVEATLEVKKPQLDEWRDAELTLRNLSKAVAKDVAVQVMGDAEVEGVPEIASLRGGGTQTARIKIRMTAEGTVPLNIEVTSHRVMDGQEYTQQSLVEIPVGKGAKEEEVAIPKEEPEEALVATEDTKCALCKGMIKEGMEMSSHTCGTPFHKPCHGRVKECPGCGEAM